MSAVKPFLNNNSADLPAGGHVKRAEGLIWRRRVDWGPSDYKFIAEMYRKLAANYKEIADCVDNEREHRFGREEAL